MQRPSWPWPLSSARPPACPNCWHTAGTQRSLEPGLKYISEVEAHVDSTHSFKCKGKSENKDMKVQARSKTWVQFRTKAANNRQVTKPHASLLLLNITLFSSLYSAMHLPAASALFLQALMLSLAAKLMLCCQEGTALAAFKVSP